MEEGAGGQSQARPGLWRRLRKGLGDRLDRTARPGRFEAAPFLPPMDRAFTLAAGYGVIHALLVWADARSTAWALGRNDAAAELNFLIATETGGVDYWRYALLNLAALAVLTFLFWSALKRAHLIAPHMLERPWSALSQRTCLNPFSTRPGTHAPLILATALLAIPAFRLAVIGGNVSAGYGGPGLLDSLLAARADFAPAGLTYAFIVWIFVMGAYTALLPAAAHMLRTLRD